MERADNMGFVALLFLLQLSEAARGVREQKLKQTERQKPYQNSRFTGKKKQESIILKLKQHICMTYFLVSSLYNM